MRQKIAAGNWKMNTTLEEGLQLASEVIHMVAEEVQTEVKTILIPPFTHLTEVSRLLKESENVFLGAQNCSEFGHGAYTGEISTDMLKATGVNYVVLGHSERREHFHESDQLLAQKLIRVLNSGLAPIFCCGEPLEIRELGNHEDYVHSQLSNGLFHLDSEQFAKCIIAYEPIWAIGTGRTASAEQAQQMHLSIRSHLATKFEEVVDETTILYGGSVKPSNAAELFASPDVDGGLVGGASLQSRDFVEIIKAL